MASPAPATLLTSSAQVHDHFDAKKHSGAVSFENRREKHLAHHGKQAAMDDIKQGRDRSTHHHHQVTVVKDDETAGELSMRTVGKNGDLKKKTEVNDDRRVANAMSEHDSKYAMKGANNLRESADKPPKAAFKNRVLKQENWKSEAEAGMRGDEEVM